MSEWVPDGHEFALCLTHDVDRPYKTYQSVYYAIEERDPSHLLDLTPLTDPYWTFDDILALESDLGVTSAFYFLDEQDLFRDRPVGEWLDPDCWRLYAGRYDILDPDVVAVMREIDERGWEVGLHGSYESYADRDLLEREKHTVEGILGHDVLGGRQHYLNLDRPETWAHQQSVGLQYDATPGSPNEYGFHDGYDPYRPFDDEFVVFPLTLMECALPDPGTDFDDAWQVCELLLAEAAANDAVMSVLWHPRFFSHDYPGYDDIYSQLIERALEMNAWVGPPGALYRGNQRSSASPIRNEERASALD